MRQQPRRPVRSPNHLNNRNRNHRISKRLQQQRLSSNTSKRSRREIMRLPDVWILPVSIEWSPPLHHAWPLFLLNRIRSTRLAGSRLSKHISPSSSGGNKAWIASGLGKTPLCFFPKISLAMRPPFLSWIGSARLL